MSRHNDILNQFNTVVLGDLDNAQAIDPDEGKPGWVLDKKLRDLVMMILIKVCDISNEARPIHVAGPWINRLLEEFFHQSDYEKLVGLPVAPFMDREKVTKSASQCGFIRFVILPLFESLAKLLPSTRNILIQPALDQLAHYTNMQKLEEEQEEEERQKASDDSDENENKSVVAVSNKSDTASEPECELSSSPTSMEHSMCEAEFGDVRSK
ncbi:unnamed protein product [Calicophoron daubneyi]|uniref:PDEase domain-containing protein n=1 Tax=Calicophoron daubneyi TaxID=300641 RepID=A0AAV2TLI4_CALDB